MKAYTSLEQSKKLTEILPIESADMHWQYIEEDNGQLQWFCFPKDFSINQHNTVSAWSLAALLDVLPEINGVNLKFERVKAEDGYNGYYYSIEYEGIILIPYSKNLVDACYEMIIRLHELKLL